MFYKHTILEVNNEELLYLYLTNSYEFAKEIGEGNREQNLIERVRNYIRNKGINFNGRKVFLVVNGVIISSLLLSKAVFSKPRITDTSLPNYQYVDIIKDFVPDLPDDGEGTEKIEPDNNQDLVINNNGSNSNINNNTTNSNQTNEQYVTVYRSNGTTQTITMTYYLMGVLASEMPASFHIEALKAQAVASRTYALNIINSNKVLTDVNSTQIYRDISYYKNYWGNNYDYYYNKIKTAVESTKGQYIIYNGKYIEALFHSTSNGKTENAIEVWGNSVPYLVSVPSIWDLDANNYSVMVNKNFDEVSSALNITIDKNTKVEILDKTTGDRIKNIKIGDSIFTGKSLRNLLGLRSTDITMQINYNSVTFTTRGYGHGVGMSQYGAAGMAKAGYNYIQILSHYYPHTQII